MRRSSSLTFFKKKKKPSGHHLHIAAALLPTQAFLASPTVRCEVPLQSGISDTSLPRLNDAALSNSLLRRSLDKSLDKRDSDEQQHFLRTSSDSHLIPPRNSSNRPSNASDDPNPVSENPTIRRRKQPAVFAQPSSSGLNRTSDGDATVPATEALSEYSRPLSASRSTRRPSLRPSISLTWVSAASGADSIVTNQGRNLDTLTQTAAGLSNGRASASGSPIHTPRRLTAGQSIKGNTEDRSESDDPFDEVTDENDSDNQSAVEIVRPVLREPLLESAGRVSLDPSLPVRSIPRSEVANFESSAPRTVTWQPGLTDSAGSPNANANTNTNTKSNVELSSASPTASLSKRSNAALRAENKVLQNAVQRLSVELSRYQAAVAVQNGELDRFLRGNNVRPALDAEDPLPLWLVDQKYLSPLFASYDALIGEKNRLLKEAKQRIDEFELRLQSLLKSSAQSQTGGIFASQIVPASFVPNGVPNNWPEIVNQCKQVIDENAELKSTVDRQVKELQEVEKFHILEVNRLNEQIKELQSDILSNRDRYASIVENFRSLEEAVSQAGQLEKSFRQSRKLDSSIGNKTVEQLQGRLMELERALEDAQKNYAAVYDRAKEFAECVVKLSREKQLLLQDKARRDKKLAKLYQRVASMRGAIQQLQFKDAEKNNLLKDLMIITDKIAKQRNELAESVQRAASQTQAAESGAVEKDLKLKWLEAMLRNSVDRVEQEQLERRKMEENLHAVWEAAITRDRSYYGRLADPLSGSVLRSRPLSREMSPSRPPLSETTRFDSATLRASFK